MDPSRQQPGATLTAAQRQQVEETCKRFQFDVLQGKQPQIDDYLDDTSLSSRRLLLEKLVELDLAFRRRSGEPASREDYSGRFPELLLEQANHDSIATSVDESPRTTSAGRRSSRRRDTNEQRNAAHCERTLHILERRENRLPRRFLRPRCRPLPGSSIRMHLTCGIQHEQECGQQVSDDRRAWRARPCGNHGRRRLSGLWLFAARTAERALPRVRPRHQDRQSD